MTDKPLTKHQLEYNKEAIKREMQPLLDDAELMLKSVVADLTTPDTFILNANNGEIISTTIGTKQKMVILVKDDEMSNKIENNSTTTATTTTAPRVATAEEVPVPLHQQNIPCLTNQHLASLLLLGRQVLKHYNNIPQDIEWAIINDQVMLLQSRPITTLQQSEESSFSNGGNDSNDRTVGSIGEFDWHCQPEDWLTTCNAQEMFPGAGTPLTISVFGSAVEYGMQSLHMDYIRTMPGYDSNVLRTGWFNGHFFINMTNTLYMLTQMLGGKMGKENGVDEGLKAFHKHLRRYCKFHFVLRFSLEGGKDLTFSLFINILLFIKR